MSILKNTSIVASKIKKGFKKAKRKISRRKYLEPNTNHSVREDKELAVFIKENIISKKPEYPEYDKASFESTMAELKQQAEEQNKINIWAEAKKEEPKEEEYATTYDLYPDYETLAYCMDALKIERPESAAEFEAKYSRKELLKIIEERINVLRLTKIRKGTLMGTYAPSNSIVEKLLAVAPYVDVFRNIKHVYIINGYARSGKDTFITLFNRVANTDCRVSNIVWNNKVCSISSVQGIKDIASEHFKYDEKRKNDKDRKFLADFKKLTTEYCDFSMNYILRNVISNDIEGANYIFIHVREPGEIDRTKEEVGKIIFPHFSDEVEKYDYDLDTLFRARKFYDVKTIFIVNDRVKKKVTNNSSDLDVENYEYDFRIDNNGTLDDLENNAAKFFYEELNFE